MRAVLQEVGGFAPSPAMGGAPMPSAGAVVNVGPAADVAKLAAAMGMPPPPAQGGWLQQLGALLEQLPHAVAVTDMKTPGLPVTMCNSAMVRLTGYSREETQGRNCRFLQGQETEAAAVRALVVGIRNARMTSVRITNYRKDGSPFTNTLTTHPVNDSNNEYRYSIGVLADAANAAQEGGALERLRSALPARFDAALQPKAFDESLQNVDLAAQKAQWRDSMVKFTRLLWSVDWEGSLRQVLMQPAGQAELRKWLQTNAPSDTAACEQVISNGPGADQAASTLAMESFPKFVQSKACLPLVRQLLGSSADDMRMQEGALWPLYKVPDDCAGWVHSFTAVAASLPACIVLSDMAMPGNPMFYVNQADPASPREFCTHACPPANARTRPPRACCLGNALYASFTSCFPPHCRSSAA